MRQEGLIAVNSLWPRTKAYAEISGLVLKLLLDFDRQ